MKSLHSTLLVLLFTLGLLLGVQIPGFIDQYEKRIEAHYLEVNENFKGFQHIADRLHSGSIKTLIKKHEVSTDPTFKAEAEPLRAIFDRKIRFEQEQQALQATFIKKIWHVTTAGDRSTIDETYQSFSAKPATEHQRNWLWSDVRVNCSNHLSTVSYTRQIHLL